MRTLLVVVSIAAGAFAVGLISGGFVSLLRDLDKDYQSANPHVATILSEPFDDDTLQAAEHVPGIAQAEGRTLLNARVRRPGGDWASVRVLAVPKLAKMRIDRLRPALGGTQLALRDKEVLVERSSLREVPVAEGDSLVLEVPGAKSQSNRRLRVAGIVHDVTIQPSTISGDINLYVNVDTMAWLGGPLLYDRMLLTVAENPADEEHVKEVARVVARKIENGDRHVLATLVSNPGQHPNAFIIRALLTLLVGLGGLSVLLSGFLVATTVNGLLGQQVRQIGLMKAMGATTAQIAGMYLVMVLAFGALALLLAAAPAALAAHWAVTQVATFLNFNAGPFRFPYEAVALQAAVAFAVPLLAALPPVLSSSRMTVREALNHQGLPPHSRLRLTFGLPAAPDTDSSRIQAPGSGRLSRPFVLSMRNTLRRRGRLAMTLTTLTLAGAIFIAVFNIRASFAGTISDTLGYFLSNVNVSLNRAYRTQQIEEIAAGVPGVVKVEGWGVVPAQVLALDEKTGIDVAMLAPPAGSKLVRPVLSAGRWLQPGDQGAIVVGNQITSQRSDIKVGDNVTLRILGKKYTWQVVGVFKMAGNMSRPLVYADYGDLTQRLDQSGRSGALHVVTQSGHNEESVAQALESRLLSAGVQVSDVTTGSQQRAQEHAGIDILVYFLIGMAGLIAMVGGLGLMGTMSINVLERTHEIGVMRAIGASDWTIIRLVLLEGAAIGVLSWALGAVLALPVSKVFSDLLGVAVVSTPLRLIVTADGFALWLGAVLLISAAASSLPAYRASRLTVREVLAYE